MGNQLSSQVVPNIEYFDSDKRFALSVIDMQNDFCEGGSLHVKEANLIIAAINKLRFIYYKEIPTFLSLDWHSPQHMSFGETHKKSNFTKEKLHLKMEDGTFINVEQDLWPVHCVENTYGSDFHHDLIVTKSDKIIKKGTKQNIESYSAFGDEFNGKYEKTYLNEWLKERKITDIILTGVATDYCVYNTALDAIRNKYQVHLIMSCTRGVAEQTTKKALSDLKDKGVKFYENVEEFYQIHKKDIIYSNHKREKI